VSENTLRRVLWADLIGSAATTVVTIIMAGPLGDFLEIPASVVAGVGVALIPWVGLLYLTVRRQPTRRGDVVSIVTGNVVWVLATATIIWGFPSALSPPGNRLLAIFGVGVLVLGLLEWRGLASLRPRVAMRQGR